MSRDIAGEPLLHPLSLAALLVLVANDHLGKQAFPGFLTGKLSDVAGMIFFPLLLATAWRWSVGRRWQPRRSEVVLLAAVLATAVVFTLVKTVPAAGDAYRFGLGSAQWPFRALLAWARAEGTPTLRPVSLVQDPTDLAALPALLVSCWIDNPEQAWGTIRARLTQGRACRPKESPDELSPDQMDPGPRPRCRHRRVPAAGGV